MASVLDLVKHYQHAIEKYPNDEHKILKAIDKLFNLDVTVQHLQDTGVGRTVNALRKEPGDVGKAARALVYKWKLMVAAEESDQEGDQSHENINYNGSTGDKDSDDNIDQTQYHSSQYEDTAKPNSIEEKSDKHLNGSESNLKRKSDQKEDEPYAKKSKYSDTGSSSKKHNKSHKTNSESDSERQHSDDSYSEDSESRTSESSQDYSIPNHKIKLEPPEDGDYSTTKHSHHSNVVIKKEPNSSTSNGSSDKHSKHHYESKHSSEKSIKKEHHSSRKHSKSTSKEKEESQEKRHRSDHKSSEKDKKSKEDSSTRKHSSTKDSHKSNSDKESLQKSKSVEKHTSKEKHSSSSKSHKSDKDKHKSSTEKTNQEDQHKSSNSSTKEKHHSSDREKSKDRKDKEKSSHSHKSDRDRSSSKSKKSDNKDKERKEHSRSSEKSSKSKSSSSSSKHRSKEDNPKKQDKNKNIEDSDDGIGCESGASFAEALGMISPAKPKKKISSKDLSSSSIENDLSPAALLAPTAKLAPLPKIEISSLPEISPNYKPRPPPKFLPHFTDEEAMSAVISSKNQRTKVYSGNKMIGKLTSLYELCVNVLQEHIDDLEYTGGVPYEILKPIVDKATPQQLFVLEHYNPYLMDDTDHLWKTFCEKHFRNKKRQEMETWREMYIRCQEEQEHKLKSLTENIKIAQEAKKAPIKQTKMAYVDTVVKPPRNIARKQAQHGTAHAATASPAARVAALATAPNVLKGGVRPTPSPSVGSSLSNNRPKKAPLMQKALQFMRGGRKR